MPDAQPLPESLTPRSHRRVDDPLTRANRAARRALAQAQRPVGKPSPVQRFLDMIDFDAQAGGQHGQTIMSREKVESILLALQVGAFRSTAARWAGVNADTLSDWIKKGQQGIEPYAGFIGAIAKMEATSEIRATRALATSGDWRAVLAFLERRHSSRWAPKAQPATPAGDFDLAALLVRSRSGESGSRVIDVTPEPEALPPVLDAPPADPRAALPSAKPKRTRVPEDLIP